jgi:2-polyprenyl-3-methyl-5-hydroxy-6-metoxy-1,4-benzoquinol methylase
VKAVVTCPGCGGTWFRAFAFTPEAERTNDIHFAQTRCRTCDLVFSNPVADAAELERYYRSEYYGQAEQAYSPDQPGMAEIMAGWERDEAVGLRDSVLPYVSGGAFFEIGAGHGRLLAGARALGFSVAGVEPSEQAARFARDVMGLEHVRQSIFDPNAWPAESFDVMYSHHVIEHVSDLPGFVDGMYRLLKPNGLVVIGTENHHNVWVQIRRVRSWFKGRRLPEFQTSNHHTFYFSARSLAALLERHGFTVIKRRVYTHSLAEKLPHYRFRSWRSQVAFYALHYADAWTSRGGRVQVWARKPI